MDPSTFSVPFLDELCNACLSDTTVRRQEAERILLEFQGLDDTWLKIPAILSETTNDQTRFFALQVLEKLVRNRWASIGPDQRKSVRDFVAGTIGSCSANRQVLAANRSYLRKLNGLLIQILQVDWPHEWPTFIDDLLASSSTDQATCENNLEILRLLSEAMYEHWEQNISAHRSDRMRNHLMLHLNSVIPLLATLLGGIHQLSPGQDSLDLGLIKAAVDTMTAFLVWIESDSLFQTGIPEALVVCLKYPKLALSAMGALSLTATLFSQDMINPDDSRDRVIDLARAVMSAVEEMLGSQGGPAPQAYAAWRETVGDDEANALASLLINIATDGIFWDEWRDHQPLLQRQNEYFFQIGLHEDDAVMKMIFDCHWHRLLEVVGHDRDRLLLPREDIVLLIGFSHNGRALLPNEGSPDLRELVEKRQWMKPFFDGMVTVAFERMVAPSEEQIGYTNSIHDEPTRELLVESEQLSLHATMRDAVVIHSHLFFFDSMALLHQKLVEFTGPTLPRAKFSRFIWVVGALATRLLVELQLPSFIKRAILQEAHVHPSPLPEEQWFVGVVQALGALRERCPAPEEQLFLDTEIVFLLGRYPKCLDVHRDLLELLLGKIFAILDGPPDTPTEAISMATDTLEIISYYNREALSRNEEGEMSLTEQLLVEQRTKVTTKYSNNLVVLSSVYGSFGAAIRALWWVEEGRRLLGILFQDINPEFQRWMDEVAKSPSAIARPEAYQFFYKALRLNISVCGSLKGGFAPQMDILSPFLPILYDSISSYIASAAQQGGVVVAGHSTVRWLRRVRCKLILLCVIHGVGIGIDSRTDPSVALESFHPSIERFGKETVPALANVVLTDWMSSPPELREVEAMDLVDQSLNNLGAILPLEMLHSVIDMIVDSMIAYIDSGDYILYSEIRRSQYFVMEMEQLPRVQQERILKIALSGMKVFNRDVAKNALGEPLPSNQMSYHFFANYPPSILVPTAFEPRRAPPPKNTEFLSFAVEPMLDSVWEIMTDAEHKNTFENQAPVVARIFTVMAESPRQVLDASQYGPGESNRGWIERWFHSALIRSFPHLAENQSTCEELFQTLWELPRTSTADEDAFGVVLRDFFLDLAQFRQAGNNKALFTKREETQDQQEAAVRERIPSLAISRRAGVILHGKVDQQEYRTAVAFADSNPMNLI
ncbi:hypothetical protein RQP46_006252 [Phenoliferia psychrophenolica]